MTAIIKTHFSIAYFGFFQVCDYPEHAGCDSSLTTTTSEPDTTTEELSTPACRDSMMTLLPHMSDCTKFYLNIGEIPYEVQCDEGKMFDPMTEVRFCGFFQNFQ